MTIQTFFSHPENWLPFLKGGWFTIFIFHIGKKIAKKAGGGGK